MITKYTLLVLTSLILCHSSALAAKGGGGGGSSGGGGTGGGGTGGVGLTPASYQITGTSDFGSVLIGNTLSQDYTLTNSGEETPATITITSDKAEFSINTSQCAFNKVKRGVSCPISIAFAPTQAISYFATVTMTYDSKGAMVQQTFFFTGTGTNPILPTPTPTPTPEPSVTPTPTPQPSATPTPTPDPTPTTPPSTKIDTTFGTNGWVMTTTDGSDLTAVATTPAAGGGVFVLAQLSSASSTSYLVLKYLSNGSLDPSFGTNGASTLPSQAGDQFHALVMKSTGAVVVVGSRLGTGKDLLAIQLSANGAPDTTFSSTGALVLDIDYGDDEATAVTIQSDGKIVIAGYSHLEGDDDVLVVRLSASGLLDTRFNGAGLSVMDFGMGDDRATALTTDSLGNIYTAGSYTVDGQSYLAVACFASSGQYCSGFASGGAYLGDVGMAQQIYRLADGRLRIAGVYGTNAALIQLTASGADDSTFGINGVVAFGSLGAWQATQILAGDQMLLSGFDGTGSVAFLVNSAGDKLWAEDLAIENSVGTQETPVGMAPAATTNGVLVIGHQEYNGYRGLFIVSTIAQ